MISSNLELMYKPRTKVVEFHESQQLPRHSAPGPLTEPKYRVHVHKDGRESQNFREVEEVKIS
jgi:hypothetical protein